MGVYYLEQKSYPIKEFEDTFDSVFLDLLKKHKICIEVEGKKLQFQFVGFFVYHNQLYFVIPKYIRTEKTETQIQSKMKLIVQVLKKHGEILPITDDTIDFLISDINHNLVSSFALSNYIINDFLKYGYYSKHKHEAAINGDGETLWTTTVDELDPYIIGGKPYYFDTYTANEYVDGSNFILQIHKWAVNYCYKLYGEWLGFSQMEIEIPCFEIEDLGSKEYLLGVIDRELQITNLDQKINLLNSIKALVKSYYNFASHQLDIYGTKNFEYVWEEVCGFIFDNQYKKFKDKIPRPKWFNSKNKQEIEKDTFIPDVVKSYKSSINHNEYFMILDAKYYNILFVDGSVKGNPPVNDVAKQLLYMEALREETEGRISRNFFLFPSDEIDNNFFHVFGDVSLGFISDESVILVYLSDMTAYNMYLSNTKLTEYDFDLLEQNVLYNYKESST